MNRLAEIDDLFSTQALSQSRSGPDAEQPAPIERGAATPWLTIPKAAEYLAASEDTVDRLITSGQLV